MQCFAKSRPSPSILCRGEGWARGLLPVGVCGVVWGAPHSQIGPLAGEACPGWFAPIKEGSVLLLLLLLHLVTKKWVHPRSPGIMVHTWSRSVLSASCLVLLCVLQVMGWLMWLAGGGGAARCHTTKPRWVEYPPAAVSN